MVRQRPYRGNAGHERHAWSDYHAPEHEDRSGGAAGWRQQRHDSPSSASYYDDGTWSWGNSSQQSEAETWVVWCDRHGVFRAMLKLGERNIHTGDTRIKFPHADPASAFVVDMSALLPFDWSLVDKPAPPSFAASAGADADEFDDWDKQSSVSSHSSGSGASFYDQGSHQTSVLTRAPWQKPRGAEGRDEQPKRYRGGAAPVAPSYDGSRDPVAIKRWKKEVKVWVKLSAPYLPPDEQGLRLWQALKGRAQEKVYERDDEDR